MSTKAARKALWRTLSTTSAAALPPTRTRWKTSGRIPWWWSPSSAARSGKNGNKGNGHGTVSRGLGGSIDGGRIAGERVAVERAKLLQDRDYPVLNDYRALLGGLFTRMWGLSPDHLQHVFPEVRAKDIALV